jgi:hypothetical protein
MDESAALLSTHVYRIVVFTAVRALAPIRIPASMHSPHPLVQKVVIFVVWTDDQIAGLVV